MTGSGGTTRSEAATVDRVLGGFHEECRDLYQRALLTVQAQEIAHWRTPIRSAATALNRRFAASDDEGADRDGWSDFVYTESVLDDVLDPLSEALGTWTLAEALNGEFEQTDRLVGSIARQLVTGESAAASAAASAAVPSGGVPEIQDYVASLQRYRAPPFRSALVRAATEARELVDAVHAWRVAVIGAAGPSNPERGAAIDAAHGALAKSVSEIAERDLASEVLLSETLAVVNIAADDARQALENAGAQGKSMITSTSDWFRRSYLNRAVALGKRKTKDRGSPAVHADWAVQQRLMIARLRSLVGTVRFSSRIRRASDEACDDVVAACGDPVDGRLGRAGDELSQALSEAQRLLSGPGRGDPDDETAVIRRLLEQGRSALAEAQSGVASTETPQRLEAAAGELVARVQRTLGTLPEWEVIANAAKVPEAEWPENEPVRLTPREWAERAFDVNTMSAARALLEGLAGKVLEVGPALERSETILAYNLEAAAELLATTPRDGEKDDDSGIAELLIGGIERTAAAVDRLRHELVQASTATVHALRLEMFAALVRFHQRLEEGDAWSAELADDWTAVRSRLSDAGSALLGEGSVAADRAVGLVSVAAARARAGVAHTRRLLGLGIRPGVAAKALKDLSALDAHAATLPFVYRRLFASTPVRDASLIAGREADIDALLHHHEEWRAGRTNTLVLIGELQSGLRTLMNGVAASLPKEVEFLRVSLEARVADERSLVRRLAEDLSAGQPSEIETFEQLAAELRSRGSVNRACHVDRFEHSFLRTIDGSRLVARALKFFSSTDTCLSWFVSVSREGWQRISRLEPGAAALVNTHRVSRLPAESLTATVLARHQRSGLLLEFDAERAPAMVARRIERAKAPKERAEVLQTAFFSALCDLSDGSVPLALFYWLRSVQYDAERECIRITWPEALDLSFLETLSWDQAFALQAFAEHTTLTVEEHSNAFAVPTERSYEVLESLGNLLLIEPSGENRPVGSQLAFATVNEAGRYRVRPVLAPLVRQMLRARRLSEH